MGNNSSSSQQDRIAYQNFVANYAFVKKVKDPRYGEISILEDKTTKEHVALKEILCKSTTDFNREIEELKGRCKISHPNIVRLIAYTSKAEDNLCASFYKILLILDYMEQDFDRDIISRRTASEYYTEEQLWYFLESVLSALLCLHSKGVAHGDLKPSNIFITKSGAYKIAEQSLLGNVMPSYALRLSGFDDVRAYLSPALVQNLARQELYPKHDAFKSDIFTLGLTALHAATLADCDKFYDWDVFSMDVEALHKRIGGLAFRYSEEFQRFVGSMLTLVESKRPTASELLERIPTQDNLLKREMEASAHHDKKPEVSSTASYGDEGSVRVQAVSVKLPHQTSKAAPEDHIMRNEAPGNQLNVRMGAKPPMLKEDYEPSPIKPLEEPNSDRLGAPESDQSQKSAFAQYNSRTSEKKETPPYVQYQYTQSIQPQPTNPEHKVEPHSIGYRPSDDIVRILNEYRNKDAVSSNSNQNLTETYSSPQTTLAKPVSRIPSYSTLPNTNVQTDSKPAPLTGSYNPVSNVNAVSSLPTATTEVTQNIQQQQPQQTPVYTSAYKPSAEIERILQEIRNRNAGVKSATSNQYSGPATNSGATSYTPTPSSLNNSTHIYQQPTPVYNNTGNTYSYTQYHQTPEIQPQQQVVSTALTTANQRDSYTKSTTPITYQPKPQEQTNQSYEPTQKFERYATAFEYPNKYPSEIERGSYGHVSGGASTSSNYNTYNGYSHNATTSTLHETKKPQYSQNENFQSQYEKENFSKGWTETNGAKNDYTKQQTQQPVQTTQQPQQTYTPLSYNPNPLQPLSTNTQHQRRQSSSSLNSNDYILIKTSHPNHCFFFV